MTPNFQNFEAVVYLRGSEMLERKSIKKWPSFALDHSSNKERWSSHVPQIAAKTVGGRQSQATRLTANVHRWNDHFPLVQMHFDLKFCFRSKMSWNQSNEEWCHVALLVMRGRFKAREVVPM